MKERKDFVKVKAREKAGLVAVIHGQSSYVFRPEGEPVELLRAEFEGKDFDEVRAKLEIVEDPATVPDLSAGRARPRALPSEKE